MSEAKAVLEERTEEITPVQPQPAKREWSKIEVVGVLVVIASMLTLLFAPSTLAGLFNSMVDRVFPIVVSVFLTGKVGVAIIASVIVGRILERLGFTDALMRIFIPVTRLIKVNSSVVIPSVYNILGDINAAGKIAGPIMVRAKATKDEQKIAVAAMVQSQQSFSTFMFGIICLTAVGVNAFIVVVLAVFLPVILVPWLLSKTIYRNTKAVDLKDLPKFTPEKRFLPTIFDSAREGAELLFLLIIPAAAAVFALIGVLDYIGIWAPIEAGLGTGLLALGIEPEAGTVAILASPTLAMAQLAEIAATVDPRLIIGTFVLASSGLPIATIVGQIPVIWAANSDLNEREALSAAVLGMVMRLITAFLIVTFLTPLLV